ncbi:MAG: hypothetical protein AAGJ11_12025 [Bacteroidota bacterium]
MTPAIARQAGALAALLTALVRGGEAVVAPSTLAVAGTVGLTVFGVLALGPPLLKRLLTPPPAPVPPPVPAPPPPADPASP